MIDKLDISTVLLADFLALPLCWYFLSRLPPPWSQFLETVKDEMSLSRYMLIFCGVFLAFTGAYIATLGALFWTLLLVVSSMLVIPLSIVWPRLIRARDHKRAHGILPTREPLTQSEIKLCCFAGLRFGLFFVPPAFLGYQQRQHDRAKFKLIISKLDSEILNQAIDGNVEVYETIGNELESVRYLTDNEKAALRKKFDVIEEKIKARPKRNPRPISRP